MTYRCNFRCRFCHYWALNADAADEPTVSEYAAGAQKLARMGSLMISLAGGEPLLRTDVCEIIEAVGRYHFPFMTTNGWFITPSLAREIMQAGCWGVSLSIDYADPDMHDRRRGMVGAAEQAWRAVDILGEARLHRWQRVNVIAVLMDDNIDQMEELCAMAAKHGAYFMVQPYGHLKTGSSLYAHNDGLVAPRLLDIRRRYPNFLSNPRYLGLFDRFLHGGVPGCRAGRAFFNIDETGDVAMCVERRHQPVGNLYRDGMGAIEKRLRACARGNTCTDCWYNCRGEIESLYHPLGLAKSLPIFLLDRGRVPRGNGDRGGGR